MSPKYTVGPDIDLDVEIVPDRLGAMPRSLS